MKLSILDQSVAIADKCQDQVINDTLNLSTIAEELGYSRFWISEHHNHPTIIGTAPEVLMAFAHSFMLLYFPVPTISLDLNFLFAIFKTSDFIIHHL